MPISSQTLVIFDVDGTLVQSTAMDADCFVRAIKEETGIKRIDADWGLYPHPTDSGILATIYETHFDRPPRREETDSIKARFLAHLKGALEDDPGLSMEVPGAADLLAGLRVTPGFSLAIATGAWDESVALKMTAAKIDISGIPMATSDDAPGRPEITLKAIERAGGREQHTVLVGDGPWDVAVARQLDIGFIGIGREREAENLKAAGAAAILPDFTDKRRFLEVVANAPVPRGR